MIELPPWIDGLAWLFLAGGFACAGIIGVDLVRQPQKMAIMNWVWPITALYAGPLALWAYIRLGRSTAAQHMGHSARPFWQSVIIGASHCGAGCTLGDIVAEFAIFFMGLTIAGSVLYAQFAGDFILAYVFGVFFQYFAIAPMRSTPFPQTLLAAVKSDTFSLIAFEIGLFGWMALAHLHVHPHLTPDRPAYWLMMQIGMCIGYLTSYPMNWWLIRAGIKEEM